MKNRYLKWSILLIAALNVCGCDVDSTYKQPVQVGKITTLASGLVVSELGQMRLIYLEPKPGTMAVKEIYRAKKSERMTWSVAGLGDGSPTDFFQMVVPADVRKEDMGEILHRFSFDGDSITETTYNVGSPFSNIAFGPAGNYAILYHSSDSDSKGDVFNPNETALLKLDEAPSDTNPSIVSVSLRGNRISGVFFLPELTVNGKKRQFTVFTGRGVVRIVDLKNPSIYDEHGLVVEDDPREVVPVQIIAKDADKKRPPMIFIRATGSEDVYTLSINEKKKGDGEIYTTLTQSPTWGGNPVDMVTAQDGETPLLIVLNAYGSKYGNSILNIVDIDTSVTFTVEMSDSPTKLLKREADKGWEVVTYGNSTDSIGFLEMDGVVDRQDRNLDEVDIPDTISEAVPLDSNRLLIVLGNYKDIAVFDLEERSPARFSAPSFDLADWDSVQIHNDFFYFVPSNKDRINWIDLKEDHPDSLFLDDYIESLHIITTTDMGVCMHRAKTGRATVFPLDTPTRENSFVVDGFYISGLLDVKED